MQIKISFSVRNERLIGLGTRVGADFLPDVAGRNLHLTYVALLCIAASVFWGVRLVSALFISDADEARTEAKCQVVDRQLD